MMRRVVIDSQPQFCLMLGQRLFPAWARTREDLADEAEEIAERLGVETHELRPLFRVMVTAVSDWTGLDEDVDWERMRHAWKQWEPPSDATVSVWDGHPW